jgi:Family of unknown function (DUF6444)
MDRQIQSLTGRVERLERELAKNSKNSSRPPSSDSPSTKKRGRPARPKGPSGKSQGAQPGHEGKGRELLPTMAVDEVVVHWPAGCECGHVFCAAECVAVGGPVRHQVEELPQISTIVVEHADARHPPSEADPAHLRWQEAPLQATPAASRRTCSRSGEPCGRSPRSRASPRPTITPSAHCAARSSTASSHSAANQPTAKLGSPDCCRRTPPAASKPAACLTTSPTCSPTTPAAPRSPCWPDSAGA